MRAPYSRNLFDLVCEMAERYTDRPAIIAGDQRVTYPELELRIRRVAAGMRAAGVGRGDRIGILVNNRPEWIEVCIASAAIGAVAVPFSTWSKRAELDFLLADSEVKVLFTLEQFGEQDYAADLIALIPELGIVVSGQWRSARYPKMDAVVAIGGSGSGGLPLIGAIDYEAFVSRHPPLDESQAPGAGGHNGDDAMILYTSGSTSYPKAVRLTQCAMLENAFNIGERQGYSPYDKVLLALPLFWSYGSANAMCATFTHGAALVLQTRFEPAGAIELIERHACTAIYTLPAMTTSIVTHPSFHQDRTRSLRTGLTIGSAQDVVNAAEILGAHEICNVYGQTESYGNCCVTWHHWPLEQRKQMQGQPLPGVTVRIVDADTGEQMPQGKVGMIEVFGNVTPGYTGTSIELNDSAFTSDGYFPTGDLGQLTVDGCLQFVGRNTEMIKRAGINVAPAEIEELLQQHGAVALAGVTGAPDADRGEMIVAFIVPVPGMEVSCEELQAHCRAIASSYKVPNRIEICEALPVTATGKVLRRELKAMATALIAPSK
ncbi:class I adenylate-forming enzyme family protein [Glaciimonas sp. CA11.2]|uniref:class I adenylate-forming enzyme family protein n=1 Tax=Glaciimonas sp. CA11.2 TaxID=3048601 RepID=UPI002AB460FA|nr:class I adenylate-forming enzyme family protein [Glaciimonas sp. CA11.2]MDY7545251.1 class I adenylate-forming enzyme family protein [Glaciimonas sp. CA11.2]MEB0161612.1 class I adenylate-forming enzyme family protein [Glaciimonas sp. CA11.2]